MPVPRVTCVCLFGCFLALFLGSSSAAELLVQMKEVPGHLSLCKHYDRVLKDELTDATEDLLGAVDAFELAAAGDIQVLFDAPIDVDADAEIVSQWRICLPVAKSSANKLTNGYELVSLSAATTATVVCEAGDQDGQACAAAMDSFLRSNHLHLTQSAQIQELADGGRQVSVAVTKAATTKAP